MYRIFYLLSTQGSHHRYEKSNEEALELDSLISEQMVNDPPDEV